MPLQKQIDSVGDYLHNYNTALNSLKIVSPYLNYHSTGFLFLISPMSMTFFQL